MKEFSMLKNVFIVLTAVVVVLTTHAQEVGVIKGESEASSIIIGGVKKTETYNAKTKNTYGITDLDSVTVFGSYTSGKTDGVESARSWLAGLRYERVIVKDIFSGFLQHQAESDVFNGIFIQRDSTDLGGKYFFVKNERTTWFGEFGFRNTVLYADQSLPKETVGYARFYTEAAQVVTDTVNVKLWVEHLPPLKDSVLSKALTNAEASISVAMSSVLSLKMAYLLNRNEAGTTETEKNKTTWTTAIVAKY